MDREYLLDRLEKLEKKYMDILGSLELSFLNPFYSRYANDELRYLRVEIEEIRKRL